MTFRSTRCQASGGEVSFRQAIFTGLAPDGGLYHPTRQPDLRPLLARFDGRTAFQDMAQEMTVELLGEELDREAAGRVVRRAFTFWPELRPLTDAVSLLELFHGPTGAFKDFGAAFLASVMEEFLADQGQRAVVLVATSGDTGGAVARAFHGRRNVEVVILYPSGRVSPLQEKQLTTLGGNVTALEVRGSFDDCQRLVKEAFLDRRLRQGLRLTSANSINLGRLLPQAFYYVYAATRLPPPRRPLIFCVPSGNFGNLTAGVYAWQWGLPVELFLAATNVNDVVPEYLRTGVFQPRASRRTLSSAMDVGDPSNLERLMAVFRGRVEAMRALIRAASITDGETRDTIARVWTEHGVLVDPHTAVGVLAAQRLAPAEGAGRVVVLATAHPGKFPEVVREVTGAEPPLPDTLARLLPLPKQSLLLEPRLPELRRVLESRYG